MEERMEPEMGSRYPSAQRSPTEVFTVHLPLARLICLVLGREKPCYDQGVPSGTSKS